MDHKKRLGKVGNEKAPALKVGRGSETWELARTLIYAIIIALGVRTVAFEPFNIPSKSMVPTLLVGDFLFVSKFAYGYSHHSLPLSPPLFDGRLFGKAPERGDVAVFKYPVDNTTAYIKRIIGLPGDRIQVISGILNINGMAVHRERIDDYVEQNLSGYREAKLPQYIETLPNGRSYEIVESKGDQATNDETPEVIVPPGHYFTMGDNRDNSADSRYWGFVPEVNLIGRADLLFFSIGGGHSIWQIWRWPQNVRFNRLFTMVN
jgi:signal peptidase I